MMGMIGGLLVFGFCLFALRKIRQRKISQADQKIRDLPRVPARHNLFNPPCSQQWHTILPPNATVRN
jgi:hypothetical protein